jgi:hypothetical protein
MVITQLHVTVIVMAIMMITWASERCTCINADRMIGLGEVRSSLVALVRVPRSCLKLKVVECMGLFCGQVVEVQHIVVVTVLSKEGISIKPAEMTPVANI